MVAEEAAGIKAAVQGEVITMVGEAEIQTEAEDEVILAVEAAGDAEGVVMGKTQMPWTTSIPRLRR